MTDQPEQTDLDTAKKSQDAGIADEGAAYTQAIPTSEDDAAEESESHPS